MKPFRAIARLKEVCCSFGQLHDTAHSRLQSKTAMATADAPSLALRLRLSRFASARGVPAADADDLAGDVWLRTYAWAQEREVDLEEVEARAMVSLKHAIVDYWSSPARVAAKRISYVLSSPQGSDPILAWESAGQVLVGYRSWQGKAPLSAQEESQSEAELSTFLFGNDGLAGTPPSGMSARALLGSLLKWIGRPCSKEFVNSLLASISVVPRHLVAIEEHHGIENSPEPTDHHTERLWSLIAGLPFRMRASILLALEVESYEQLHESAGVPPHSALQDWPPPPPLDAISFPWDDGKLAQKLGVTKGNLHVIRKRARDILRRGMADELGGGQ